MSILSTQLKGIVSIGQTLWIQLRNALLGLVLLGAFIYAMIHLRLFN